MSKVHRKPNLNYDLLEEIGIEQPVIDLIEKNTQKLFDLLYDPEKHSESPADAARLIEGYEFALQAMWGFELDPIKHKYWYQVKGCTCPKPDNAGRWGTKYKIIIASCPFHGECSTDPW